MIIRKVLKNKQNTSPVRTMQTTVRKMVLMLQLECGTKILFFSILLMFLSLKKRGSTRENVVATRAHLPN